MGYPSKKKQTKKVGDMEFLGGGWEVIASVLIPPTVLIQYGFLGFFYGIAVSKASLTLARSTWRVREVLTPLTNFRPKNILK